MPICFSCGREVSEQSNFCPYCCTQLRELPPDVAAIVAGRTEEERLTPMEVTSWVSLDTGLLQAMQEVRRREQKSSLVLIGPDGEPYHSDQPPIFSGNRKLKIYGRLECSSARASSRGSPELYRKIRVFFVDEETAQAAGYRPCGKCMKEQYKRWKAGELVIPNHPVKQDDQKSSGPSGVENA